MIDLAHAGDGTIVHLRLLPGLVEDYRALVLFFAHGVLRGEPAGSADIDVEEVEEPGLDADGFGDGGGVAVVGGDQAQVGQRAEDGPAGGAGGGQAVAGQAGHHLGVRGQCLADLPFDQAEDQQGQADHGDQGGDDRLPEASTTARSENDAQIAV